MNWTVLVVDDSPIDRRLASGLLVKAGFDTQVAANGHAAMTSIANARPDLVVTDLAMPEMDGLELVQSVRERYPDIPVILMTAVGSEDIAVRALQAGAASYVRKRDLARSLADTVRSILAVRDHQPHSTRSLSATRWEIGNDLAEIGPVVGILESRLASFGIQDETMRIQISVALREAIVNAILHGNLGLASELKESEIDAHDALYEARRFELPWRERRVTITLVETITEAIFTVSDDGLGFDTSIVSDPTASANLERTSGRGLFLMRMFMDEVRHTADGRTVTMVKRLPQGA